MRGSRAGVRGSLNPPQPPPKIIACGQILSYVLRQPQLARAVGVVYPVTLNVPQLCFRTAAGSISRSTRLPPHTLT